MRPPMSGNHPPFAILTSPDADPIVKRAATMLTEEVDRRARPTPAPPGTRLILTAVVGLHDDVMRLVPGLHLAEPVRRHARLAPEGYVVQCVPGPAASTVVVAGNDSLGTLFGVGRLLRECRCGPARIELPPGFAISSAPHMPIRGMQLGYRDVNNTLDVWDVPQFDQYLRDLILFGCNAVELTPPESAPRDSRGEREREMNLRLAELVHSYGLQVSLWVPVTEHDPREPAGRQRILDDRRQLFRIMPHVDHVFVPSGDPGDTPADVLLPLLADMAAALHETHPGAGMWVSDQGLEPPERDWLYRFLAEQHPDWLRGIVFGPWTRDTIEHTREMVPLPYQVRAYPDITHSCRCQYPVPGWDQALALVEGREVCNPRPEQYRTVFHHIAPHCDGFIAYSDGVHDDANKMLWLALGWDPASDLQGILREYGRTLIGPDVEEDVARGLIGLERNWTGPIGPGGSIRDTLSVWERIHTAYPGNWRVQLHYFRGLCDRYVQLKKSNDQSRERRAHAYLAKALGGDLSPRAAISRARRLLARPTPPRLQQMREALWSLGRELREGIGLQMSVELGGQDERGNVLDYLDEPLNNARWTCSRLASAERWDEAQQLAAIARILSWQDPGPGGFYDDLGNAARQPHLMQPVPWEDDPGCYRRAYEEFSFLQYAESGRLSWRSSATALYDAPLRLRYTGLDPRAGYVLRVVYAGRFGPTMTLTANGTWQIHGPLSGPDPPDVLEFAIPHEATAEGVLDLEWRRVNRQGRGPQVAEAWLVRAT